MVYARLCRWLIFLACILSSLRADALPVGITYVQNAVAKGAVCLDGSPPAYHLDRGSGPGINNWLVHIEGGGWCNNVTTCLARKDNRLGSSKKMVTELAFSGILSNKQQFNPDFYSWNRVKVRYCDGSSFTGDVEAVDPATGLYFRGARVWLAVIEDLLAKGLKSAENALLSGCSAGGLTSILHCDSFRALVPMSTKVKCLSDAGYFINTKDVSGTQHIQAFYNDVVNVHGSAKNLPVSCTSQMKPSMCFFPQYMAQQIRTPLFILNAAYDSWQIKNILAPGVADPHGTWHYCKLDIKQCSSSQLETMQGIFAAPGYHVKQPIALKARAVRGCCVNVYQGTLTFHVPKPSMDLHFHRLQLTEMNHDVLFLHGRKTSLDAGFRLEFLSALTGLGTSSSRGMFINSCYAHCQSEMQETWLRADSPVLGNTTIAKAVGDWYFDRSPFQKIDCPYPCDKSCHNRIFDPQEHPGA